jgi:DnaJ-class molecular chaperone
LIERRIPQEHRPNHPPPAKQTETRTCGTCRGAGEVLNDVQYRYDSGELVQGLTECPVCDGTGSIEAYRYPARSGGGTS